MHTGYITREEFGVRLFEVIQTIGGIQACEWQMAEAMKQGEAATHAAAKARWLQAKDVLAKTLPMLTGQELDQVLARYPDVVSM